METLLAFISAYSSYWPLTVFILLIMAGFNLPVSEDAVIIISVGMVHENPSIFVQTYAALYAGIVLSDIISFTIGNLLSRGLLQVRFFKKMLSPKRMAWVSRKLEKNGFLTFITVRFIPFGVRNALFISSGFARLPYSKFILFDSIAALISSSTLFFLVYFIGQKAKESLELVGIILFCVLVAAAISFLIYFLVKKKRGVDAGDCDAADGGVPVMNGSVADSDVTAVEAADNRDIGQSVSSE